MSNALTILSKNRSFAVKGKQFVMEYDLDFPERTTLIRQRLFFIPGSPDVFTPLTPTIEQRLRPLDKGCPVPTKLPFDPRTVTACFPNPANTQGFSEYSIFIPYRPNEDRMKQCLKEVLEIPEVDIISYSGETHDIGVKNYVS